MNVPVRTVIRLTDGSAANSGQDLTDVLSSWQTATGPFAVELVGGEAGYFNPENVVCIHPPLTRRGSFDAAERS